MTAPAAAPEVTLAEAINAEHYKATGKAREALEHARRAGELLLQAKGAMPHGKWLPWLAASVSVSERTARNYMRLASHWTLLQDKSATVADLGLSHALTLLAEARPTAPPARASASRNVTNASRPTVSPSARSYALSPTEARITPQEFGFLAAFCDPRRHPPAMQADARAALTIVERLAPQFAAGREDASPFASIDTSLKRLH